MTCCVCGLEFTPKYPRRPGKTCSRACTNKMVWAQNRETRAKCGPKPRPRVIRSCEFCGKPIPLVSRPGVQERRQYCSKLCSGRGKTKGGLVFKPDRGRWMVRLRDGGWQIYARCVMEGHLGRDLATDEVVHHINRDKTDDRLENLQVVSRSEHRRIHEAEMVSARKLQAEQARILRSQGRA